MAAGVAVFRVKHVIDLSTYEITIPPSLSRFLLQATLRPPECYLGIYPRVYLLAP